MPWMIYLILRSGHRPRLEGRTTSMQRLQDVCMPKRFRGADEAEHRLETIMPECFRQPPSFARSPSKLLNNH